MKDKINEIGLPKFIGGVVLVALAVVILQDALFSPRERELEDLIILQSEVQELSERVEELENLVIEVNKELEASEQPNAPESNESNESEVAPENELSHDLNKGYSIVKKSIKDFVGKLGE